MNTRNFSKLARCAAALAACMLVPSASAQRGRGPQGPQVVSPEISADRRVTFRILAAKAETVRLSGGDIPGNGRGAEMTKGTNGVWEVTLGPIEPGTYRYNFSVDGVSVIDPRSSAISESNNNVWSLVYVPGADFMDAKDVPHGAVSTVTYYSTSLKRFRRMHVYTPPGYESGKGRFPVFYLLHGAGDCDQAWTSVGRAGFILDNLIAAGKAKPMVIVMPGGGPGGAPQGPSFEEQHKAILDDAKLKKGLKLFWFATGKDDFLVNTSRATVEMFKKHGFSAVYKETEGAHTWINWRNYLNEFAPQLFQ